MPQIHFGELLKSLAEFKIQKIDQWISTCEPHPNSPDDVIFRKGQDITIIHVERYKSAFAHGQFRGMSQEEIEALKVAQKVEFLPAIYIQIMETMGHSVGGVFFKGGTWGSGIAYLKDNCLSEQIGCDNIYELPDDAFIFFTIQDTEYWYFRTTERNDDPDVYFFKPCRVTDPINLGPLSTWFIVQSVHNESYLWGIAEHYIFRELTSEDKRNSDNDVNEIPF